MTDSQISEFSESGYLLPGEAARQLGVSTTTLATWAALGRVEAITLPSGHRRYLASSIEALIERRSA